MSRLWFVVKTGFIIAAMSLFAAVLTAVVVLYGAYFLLLLIL